MPHSDDGVECDGDHGHGHGHARRPTGFAPGRYPLAAPPIKLPARPPFYLRAVPKPRCAEAGGGEVPVVCMFSRGPNGEAAEGAAAAAAAGAAAGGGGAAVAVSAGGGVICGANLLGAGHVALAPAAARVRGSAASAAAFVEDVLLWDEQSEHCDVGNTRLHRRVLEVMVGDEGVALLEAMPAGERRISSSAWVFTGADIAKLASHGMRSHLHMLDTPVAMPKASVAEMD